MYKRQGDGHAPVPGDRPHIRGGDVARREAGEHRRKICGADRQQVAVARKGLKPARERDAVRLGHARDVDARADARAFREHHRGADDPALRDVLGRRGKAGLRKGRQQREVRAQPRPWRVRSRLPVRERLAIAAAQIDRCYQVIAGACIKRREKPLGAAEDGDRELPAVGAGIGVAADDRNAEGVRGRPHPGQHRACLDIARRPDRVDHGDGPAAHRGNVGDVDHHPAPAGEPGIAGDELVHEAFDGEQQKAVAVGDRGAIVADRDGRRARQTEPLGHGRDVALGFEAAPIAQRRGQLAEGRRARHHAAFLLGSDRNPVAASAIGG